MSHPDDELAARRRTHSSVQSRIPSQQEYEMHEWQEYQRQIQAVEKASLSDRKEACASFLEAMRDSPDLVGERVGWLLSGNYGKGSYDSAWRVMGMNARANKSASLTHMIATLEWQCPARMAIAAWKKLTSEQKAKLDAAVKAEIKYAAEEKARG